MSVCVCFYYYTIALPVNAMFSHYQSFHYFARLCVTPAMAASLVGQSRYFNDGDGSNNVARTPRK
jgi:hypothetical protein